jgi:hypothetical protein
MPLTLTPDVVSSLWTYMQRRYGTTVVPKESAPEMRVASVFLPTPKFLTNYVTTIGRRIYVPFTVGVVNNNWTLAGQAAVCAHEHQHVVQLAREGLWFQIGYALGTSKRAAYEVEAYRATLEMQWYLFGTLGDPERMAEGLVNYGCTAADVETSKRALAAHAAQVRAGLVGTEAARAAIAYLEVLRISRSFLT